MVLVPWLLGASIARAGFKDRVPALLSAAVAAVSIFALHIHLSTGGAVYTWKVNLLTAAAFAGIIWTSERVPRIWSFAMINAAIAWGASWSYSLYLIHHSIMSDFASEVTGSLYALPWMVAFSVMASILFAMMTEVHHRRLAIWLKQQLRPRTDLAKTGYIRARPLKAFWAATLKLLALVPSSCSLAENTCKPNNGAAMSIDAADPDTRL